MKNNEKLQKDVQQALDYEPLLHKAEIGVIVHEGVVTLTGSVDQYQKKLAAEKAAKNVKGVRAVAEEIAVLPEVHPKTDEEIAHALVKALKRSWNVPEDQVVSKVEDGWIWLEGTVQWEFQRRAARSVAAALLGVKGITNNILLKSEVKDKIAKEKVQDALKHNWAVDPTNIRVKVDEHKVTLEGTVDSVYERSQAVRMAWNTPGITQVVNRLEVEFADDIY